MACLPFHSIPSRQLPNVFPLFYLSSAEIDGAHATTRATALQPDPRSHRDCSNAHATMQFSPTIVVSAIVKIQGGYSQVKIDAKNYSISEKDSTNYSQKANKNFYFKILHYFSKHGVLNNINRLFIIIIIIYLLLTWGFKIISRRRG